MPKKEQRSGSRKKLEPLTDAERHKRFVYMAREVQASNDPREFEKAFREVVGPPRRKKKEG